MKMDSVNVYKDRILHQGDTSAYKELKVIMLELPPEELFLWAYIMAEKYDYPQAYMDVFYTILWVNNDYEYYYFMDIKQSTMDEKMRTIALKYLKKAHKKGVKI